MNIWAHRGCSQMYPENTLLAFGKAAEINGLTGIELDIQLTKDGHMVVFHDESLERTTNGIGRLCDFTLSELRKLKINSINGGYERIPTITEVFDLLEKRLKSGLKLNIELKNNIIPYEGMEYKIIDLVHKCGLKDRVIYSSFSALSIERIKGLDPEAELPFLMLRFLIAYTSLRVAVVQRHFIPFGEELICLLIELKGIRFVHGSQDIYILKNQREEDLI